MRHRLAGTGDKRVFNLRIIRELFDGSQQKTKVPTVVVRLVSARMVRQILFILTYLLVLDSENV